MWTLTYFLTFRSYPIEQRSMGFVLRAAAAVATAATAAADAVVIRAAAATEAIRAVAAQGLGHFLVPVGADVQGVAAVHVADGETTDERLRQFISQYEQRIFNIELWRDMEKFDEKFISNKEHYTDFVTIRLHQVAVNKRLDDMQMKMKGDILKLNKRLRNVDDESRGASWSDTEDVVADFGRSVCRRVS